MKGFIYRLGVSVKQTGENLRLDCLIRLGLAIREFAAGR
jgi:hypothetical protein